MRNGHEGRTKMAAVVHFLILFLASGYDHATAVGNAVDEMFFSQKTDGGVSFLIVLGGHAFMPTILVPWVRFAVNLT